MRWICIDQRMVNLDHVVNVFPVFRVGRAKAEDSYVLRFEVVAGSIEFRFNNRDNLIMVFEALGEAVQCDPIMMTVPLKVTKSHEKVTRGQWVEELEK